MAGVIKHGGCPNGEPSKEYKAWQHLNQRVQNPDSYAYKLEVGFSSYQEFYEDIGPCPNPAYSVDRINNDLGYIKGNVRWANSNTQNSNKSNAIMVDTPTGKMNLKEACRVYNLKYTTARYRILKGHTINWS